jgi:hypothetical protein
MRAAFFALAFLAPSLVMAADLDAEIRQARDVAGLDLKRIGATPGEVWAVFRIDPAPGSGKVRFPGITVGSGKVTAAPGAHPEAAVEGRAEVVELLAGQLAERSFSYRWPLDLLAPRGEDAAPYSPFRRGGTVIARLDLPRDRKAGDRIEEPGRFGPVFLIPEGWQTRVTPAIVALHQGAPLAAGANPFLSVAAFRGHEADRKDRIAAARGLEQAALLYLYLASLLPPGEDPGDRLAALGLPAAKDEPRGFGLGAAAAWLYGASPATREAGEAVLTRLRSSRGFAAGAWAANRDLAAFLQAMP